MQRIWRWAAHGQMEPAQLETTGRELGLLPDRESWRQFLDRALLGGGALGVGLALIFLIAANWSELGHWLRFGAAQIAVLGGTLIYAHFGDSRAGRAGLGFSFMVLGALMALFGQTYQTGVDPYHLFANWALLSLPWVCLARHSVLWLAWLLLVDIALLRWLNYRVNVWGLFNANEWLAWALIAVHGLGFLFVEFGALIGFSPGRRQWLRIALWLVLLGAASTLALTAIVGNDDELKMPALALIAYAAVVGAGGWLLRVRELSLIGLAALCASLITLFVCAVAEFVDESDFVGNLLLLAMLVTVCTALAGYWLLNIHRQSAGDR